MRYLFGIDFGGGSSKATLLREDGVTVAENSVEYPTLYPETGACEQAPSDWISALCENTRAILDKSGVSPRDIAAVAVDSATHTAVLCDGAFRPLRPAIHWTDSRSRLEAKLLCERYGEQIFEKTFHKPDTIWTLAHLLWLRERERATFDRIRHVMFEKDYLRYFLTGVFATDDIEAEGSMLFDCRRRVWDGALCDLCGLDASVWPPVHRPTDIVGAVTPEAAEATGLAVGTPVVCGTTDTALEVFASGAVSLGDMTVKLATAGRICVITDRPYPDRHMINYSHVVNGLYYPGTATKAAAASYRWYRDTFGGDYATLDAAAENIPAGCDGLFYHPYLNGELTPYADPALSASFTGMRATHTRAHFTRAVLEGVAFSLLDCKRYLDSLGIPYGGEATLIGGGAKSALWRQIAADVLGMTLRTTENADSSLGSAMLAGMAVGIFADERDAVCRSVRVTGYTEPRPTYTEKYAELFLKYKEIHDALAPVYGREG